MSLSRLIGACSDSLTICVCFSHWREQIGAVFERDPGQAFTTLQGILRTLMLRRTKETKDKHGEPIIKLPSSTVETVYLDFDDAERNFYQVGGVNVCVCLLSNPVFLFYSFFCTGGVCALASDIF